MKCAAHRNDLAPTRNGALADAQGIGHLLLSPEVGQDLVFAHNDILELQFLSRQEDTNRSSRTLVHSDGVSYPGQQIKELREERKMSQAEVCAAVGVTQKAISLLERDVGRVPESQTLLNLAKLFGVEPNWILLRRGPRNATPALTEEESELLLLFRTVSDAGKAYLLSRTRDIYADEFRTHPKPPEPARARLEADRQKSN